MRLTQASVYAIHALSFMAARKKSGPVPSHLIAKTQKIPEKFLLKLLKSLAQAGVLRSVRGPGGGYRLARGAADISLLEILIALDDPILGQITAASDHTDPKLDRRLEEVWEHVGGQLRRHFARIRLSELAGKPKRAGVT
jgi:Rrf2 family protein